MTTAYVKEDFFKGADFFYPLQGWDGGRDFQQALRESSAVECLSQKYLRKFRIYVVLIEAFDQLAREFTTNTESIISENGDELSITPKEMQGYQQFIAHVHSWQEIALKCSQVKERIINALSNLYCIEEHGLTYKLHEKLFAIREKHTEWIDAQTEEFKKKLLSQTDKIWHLANNRVFLKAILMNRSLSVEKNAEGISIPVVQVCLLGKKIAKAAARCKLPYSSR